MKEAQSHTKKCLNHAKKQCFRCRRYKAAQLIHAKLHIPSTPLRHFAYNAISISQNRDAYCVLVARAEISWHRTLEESTAISTVLHGDHIDRNGLPCHT
nr:AlNc14C47G3791 [Albugo laibachii Nc14]|eukprot:CCA18250.1 AlNc14C47G3791 [Albugo laibachii Nc14]